MLMEYSKQMTASGAYAEFAVHLKRSEMQSNMNKTSQ